MPPPAFGDKPYLTRAQRTRIKAPMDSHTPEACAVGVGRVESEWVIEDYSTGRLRNYAQALEVRVDREIRRAHRDY